MRFYLKNPLLQSYVLSRPGPVFASTPTFHVIDIGRMPPAYQLEHQIIDSLSHHATSDQSP